MSIDAIGTSAVSGVSATIAAKPPGQEGPAQQDATVVTISNEVLLQQQAAEVAARLALAAADAANGTSVENSATQDAIDALSRASRENLLVESEAQADARDHAALADKSVNAAAVTAAAEQKVIEGSAINANIQVAYGGVATPLTGDPALRQPGLNVIA